MNILITGGAGFIGSNLANSLVENNFEVSILDNLDSQIHGKNPKNSYTYKTLKNKIKKYISDISDFNQIEKKIIGKEVIVHMAAQTGTGQSMYQTKRYFDVNVNGTINLFEAIKKNNTKIKKFVLASSRSIYGEGKYFCETHGSVFPETRHMEDLVNKEFECKCPYCNKDVSCVETDEHSKTNPVSFYALTKLMQEDIVKYYCRLLGIPYVIFRMQNIYGEGQSLINPYTGIISIFSSLLTQNKNLDIFEDGEESRDFVYIKDVVKAYRMAIISNDVTNKIFNLGSGKRTSVLKLSKVLKRLTSSDSEIKITGKFRVGDIRHNVADITSINKDLQFIPEYPLGKGLNNFLEWSKNEDDKNVNYFESLKQLRQNNLLIEPGYTRAIA